MHSHDSTQVQQLDKFLNRGLLGASSRAEALRWCRVKVSIKKLLAALPPLAIPVAASVLLREMTGSSQL
jgi:hypothetical protein